MGGFLGIGHSSAKTDRGAQLGARQGLWNVFNWSLPEGESGQKSGQSTLQGALKPLGEAQQYFSNLLTAGRTQTEARLAPAINATEAQADATRAQAGEFGTSRVGGTAAANRTASMNTEASIDNLIASGLAQGQATGAEGLVGVSSAQAAIATEQLTNALALLGLSESSVNAILGNATESRSISANLNKQAQQQWIQAIEGLLTAPTTFGAGGGGASGVADAIGGIAGGG